MALLTEMTLNFPKNLADWQIIAEKISDDSFKPSGRGTRERWLKTIYAKHKSNNAASLKRSGE